jgi:diguanylate cyclase (GGDEF)-like protein/putative nucleotidyltransferase with HDIG domain
VTAISPANTRLALVAGTLIACGAFLIVLLSPGLSNTFKTTYADYFGTFAAAVGGAYAICAAIASKSHPFVRRTAWILIGLSGVAYSLGEAAWTHYEAILHVEVPNPSWADAGWLAFYPFLLSGIFLLFHHVHVTSRMRLLLDSGLASTIIAVPVWHFLIVRLWTNSQVHLLGKLVSIAYPFLDVVVVFGAVVLLQAGANSGARRRSIAFLASGAICFAFGDLLYAIDSLNASYHTASWYSWSWPFGGLLIGYAGLVDLWAGRPRENVKVLPAPGLLRIIFPYLSSALSITMVVAYDLIVKGSLSASVTITSISLMLLVSIRQILSMLENRALAKQLEGFNEDLENLVAKRTLQMQSHISLTQAVMSSLDRDAVTQMAVEHTKLSLRADAVGLWLMDPFAYPAPRLELAQHDSLITHPDLLASTAWPSCEPMQAECTQLSFRTGEWKGRLAHLATLTLTWQDEVIGRIGLVRLEEEFTPMELSLLRGFGLEIGAALKNAQLYQSARDASDRDMLTNLYNHRSFLQRFEREFRTIRDTETPLALVMIDLANFKLINHTYGHQVGDQVLRHLSNLILEACGPGDIVGRYRGDQFIVALSNTGLDDGLEFATSLRERAMLEGLKQEDDVVVPVPINIAVAGYPFDAQNHHALLAIVEENLEQAKRSDEGVYATSLNQRENNAVRTERTFSFLDSMVTAVDNKDRYTRHHSEDVTEYSLWIAERLGMSDNVCRIIRVAGLLHDVGKIGVPDDVLRKPGKLNDDEYEVMKQHPVIGAMIVSALPGMEEVVPAVRSHHERWDGKGYPDGLAGTASPVIARLMGVADAFSAMTTDRPYRKGMKWEIALERIKHGMGTHFDPEMAAAFLHAVEERTGKRPRQSSEKHFKKAA